jgi:hypothetical protein
MMDGRHTITANVSGLCVRAGFKHKSLIEEQQLKLALNPPFCQTAVMWPALFFNRL